VAYLGHDGTGPDWPYEIDTIQTFVNGPSPAPDSDTRLDAELVNDLLRTLRVFEVTMGTQPQGGFASVAARLNFYLPDVGVPPNVIGFVNETTLIVPGTQHQLGTPQLVWNLWDAGTPRHTIEPGSFTVHPTSYDVQLTFNVPQSGTLVLDAPTARYEAAITTVANTPLTIPGTAHSLATADLFWALYTDATPRVALVPQRLTVHPSSFDVQITTSTSGTFRLVLTPGRTAYATNFSAVSTPPFTVLGTTHDLLSAALLAQVYDNATPREAIPPGSLTVDPASFNVELAFNVAQSGRLLLAAVAPPPGAPLTLSALAVQQQTQWPRTGPIDPVPVLMRTVQALEARIMALEESQLALLSHLTAPMPEEPSA
jgi:hypothetical protein